MLEWVVFDARIGYTFPALEIKQYHIWHVCFQCLAKTSLCFARTFPLSWFAEVPIEEQPTLKVAWDLSGKCCKSRKLETTFEINGWHDLGRVICDSKWFFDIFCSCYIFDYFCITWLEQLHAKEIAKPLPRITYFVPAHSVSEKNELHRYLWPSLVDQLEWSRVVVKWMGLNGSLLLRHVFDSLPLLRRPRWLSRWAAALCAHGGHPHSCRRFVMVTVKWRSALSPKAQKERHVQDRLLRPPHKEMMHPECLGSHRQWNSAWYYIHGISCRAKCVWGGKSNPSGQTINFSLLCPLDAGEQGCCWH